jgi:hypothetical protein
MLDNSIRIDYNRCVTREKTMNRRSKEMLELDERTKKYIDAIRSKMGYIGMNCGYESIVDTAKKNNIEITKSQSTFKHQLSQPPCKCDVYTYTKNGQSRYACEFAEQTEIDDYQIVSYITTKPIGKDDIATLDLLIFIEVSFLTDRLEAEFECWECGKKTHWLDIEGNLQKKFAALEERYCGC